MLNIENTQLPYTIDCIRDCDFVFLVRPCDPGNGNIRVVMTEISYEEEQLLDSGKSLLLTRGGLSFSIDPYFCFAYGALNINPNSDELSQMDKADWFERYSIRQFVPSEYDFENHCIHSDRRLGRWYDTRSIKTYLPYLYNCINHPERVVIFKEYLNTLDIIKAKKRLEIDTRYYNKHKDKISKRVQEKRKIKRQSRIKLLTFNIK